MVGSLLVYQRSNGALPHNTPRPQIAGRAVSSLTRAACTQHQVHQWTVSLCYSGVCKLGRRRLNIPTPTYVVRHKEMCAISCWVPQFHVRNVGVWDRELYSRQWCNDDSKVVLLLWSHLNLHMICWMYDLRREEYSSVCWRLLGLVLNLMQYVGKSLMVWLHYVLLLWYSPQK